MTIKEHIITAVAAAAVLAVGGSTIGVKINDARQDDRIARLESLDGDIQGLREDLQKVDRKLERLDGKLEGRDDVSRD